MNNGTCVIQIHDYYSYRGEGLGMPTDRYEWRAHPAPGCAWSWSPGEMVDVMGCLRSHVISLIWLRVLEIHRVGEVGHRQPPLHRHTTRKGGTTTPNTVHKQSPHRKACYTSWVDKPAA